MYWKIKKNSQAEKLAQLREKTAEKRLLEREQNLIAVTNNFEKSLDNYRTKQLLVIELLNISGELPRFKVVDFLIYLGLAKENTELFLRNMRVRGTICCYRKNKQYYYSISERLKNSAYFFKFFIGVATYNKATDQLDITRLQNIITATRILKFLKQNPFKNIIQIANGLFISIRALGSFLSKMYNECILTRSKMRLHNQGSFYYSLSLQDLEFKQQFCVNKINDFLN